MPTSEPDSPDPRFPGTMNYIDWLHSVLKPTELTQRNVEEIIDDLRARREAHEAGGRAPKKRDTRTGKELVAALGLARRAPTIMRRPVRG